MLPEERFLQGRKRVARGKFPSFGGGRGWLIIGRRRSNLLIYAINKNYYVKAAPPLIFTRY
jgi:hypothetical protein